MYRTRQLAIATLVVSLGGCAHHRLPELAHQEYKDLLQYEGIYEYEHDTTLQIAASPKDKILVALLGDALYPLHPSGPDTFTDPQKRPVVFQRGSGVKGYVLPDGRLYRRLRSAPRLPVETWYPRLPWRPEYRYAVPPREDDGLPVQSVEAAGLDRSRLETMVRRIAEGQHPDVHSVLIVKSGALVFEEYFYAYGRDTVHPMRSATKSIVSALAGIAIDKGILPNVQARVLPYLEGDYPRLENVTEAKRRITLEHLLTHASGLACDDYDAKSPGNEVQMGATADWVKFILDLPMIDEPGASARYCSGGVITAARVLEKASGMPIADFARKHLFEPLGVRRFHWRFVPDRSSNDTACQISLRPRDMAKFGLLFRRGGRWQGRQILSREWVEASTRKHVVIDDTDYGYLWWRPSVDAGARRHHALLATGNGGQKIYVWPELDMIVVLTGGSYNRPSSARQLVADYILPTR